jgi:DNA-binding XRE family transcriptional regulator
MFGQMVRMHRRRSGFTQEVLADRAGVSARNLRDIEAGRVTRPRSDTVRLIADALDLCGPERARLYESMLTAVTGPPATVAAGSRLLLGRPIPAQLPSDLSGFVGRTAHLEELTALVGGFRQSATAVVAAVAGAAGVGKTALAVHWAHQVTGQFPDGQLYVNLRGFDAHGPAATPADVVGCFLDALGVPAARVPATLDAQVGLYRSMLAGRRMLVVFDNARDAAQVRPLLPGAPGCLALVTSRDQLISLAATDDARLVKVDVISNGEARRLLAWRLSEERVAAHPDATDEVIASCGGLPMALAMVAARAAAHPDFPLTVVAEELRSTRRRLDAFDDDSDPDTSLRSAFAGSYRTLSGPAARLFRLLGHHPGAGISLPAVAGLLTSSAPDARRLLAELVRAHLITEHAPGRYALHDLLHAYAGELAADLDSPSSQRAVAHRPSA